MYILLAYFKMFVLCYFNIDLYMFDKINLLLLLLHIQAMNRALCFTSAKCCRLVANLARFIIISQVIDDNVERNPADAQ